MFKVIVAGSRDFADYSFLKQILNEVLKNKKQNEIEIVSGLARGADSLALLYAKEYNLAVKKFPAEWNNLGNMAGFKRNLVMAQYADACVVFWDGASTGTKHMIKIARYNELKLRIINY